MKKGFTLIELLGVIILLAIISLMATPIILNVVNDAQESADMTTAQLIVSSGHNYYAASLFDEAKKMKIDNLADIYNEIEMTNKPDPGQLYVNSNDQVAIAVIINNKCYKKNFIEDIEVVGTEECDLGFVGQDEIAPTISQEVINTSANSNDWYKEDIYLQINVTDNESGVAGYKRCMGSSECTPDSTIYSTDNQIYINTESDSNYVCVIGVDNYGNESDKECIIYKLDKTAPTLEGVGDLTVKLNEPVDLSANVTYSDVLSQIDGELVINPSTVDTSTIGTKPVTYSISDKAGNIREVIRNIIVDAEAPTITFSLVDSSAINENGWAKSNFYVRATITDNSGTGIASASSCTTNSSSECEPIASFTGTTKDFYIESEGSNRACIQVTDNNNETTKICSDTYKLDKTVPTAGTATFAGTLGSNDWYTSNVTVNVTDGSDSLSGHSNTNSSVSSITANTSGTTVTITTTDLAGNSATRNYTIKVDKDSPSLVAKDGVVEINDGDSNVVSNYFTVSYSISGGSMTCNPTNTNSLGVGSQTLSCTATGDNGLTTTATKEIFVSGPLIDILMQQYDETNETGLVQDETNSNIYYYTGTNEEVSNNYLWYGGHHWRVLEIDTAANTLLLISQQPLTSIQPASSTWTTQEEYESSYINNWLNDYFYNSLDISVQNSIVDNVFNIGIYTDVDEITTTQKVGLLDEAQYTKAGGQYSFLDIKDFWWLGNRYDSYYNIRHVSQNGSLTYYQSLFAYGVRAVIKISDLTITGGNGTLEANYEAGNKATNTSDIQVGEYINVSYSGDDNACGDDNKCTFRVVSKDSDSIKVVLNGSLPNNSVYGDTEIITTSHTIYTPLNTFANNISSDYRYTGNKTFYIGEYKGWANYTDVQDETLQANIGLPTVGEMFSGNDIDMSSLPTNPKIFVNVSTIENPIVSYMYWTMNRDDLSRVSYVNESGTIGYGGPTLVLGVRPVIFLKNNLTFTSGKGTAESPYELQ